MKRLLLLLFLAPLTSMAQTTDPHHEAMEKFKKFYNAAQGDSINAMFGRVWDKMKSTKPLWTNATAAEYLKEYGKLKSFKFIGIDKEDPEEVHVFQTVFSKKGSKLTSLTIDDDNRLGTFRFITSSDRLTRLLHEFKRASK